MNRKDSAILKAIGACDEARAWVKGVKDMREAWETCPRSDWMLWALDKIDFKDDRKFRLYACACIRGTPLADGRTLWDLLTDERSRKAVEVAERYAEGEATDQERAAARAAAWDAARAAAWVAARAAARDAARAAARDAAWDAARDWQAKLLRQRVSWDEVEQAIAAYKSSKT